MDYTLQLSLDCYSKPDRELILKEILDNIEMLSYLSTEISLTTNDKSLLQHAFSSYTTEIKPFAEICIFNSAGKIYHTSHYSEYMMISFKEIFRTINAVIKVDRHGELCPANWGPEKRTITANAWDSADYILKELLS